MIGGGESISNTKYRIILIIIKMRVLYDESIYKFISQ